MGCGASSEHRGSSSEHHTEIKHDPSHTVLVLETGTAVAFGSNDDGQTTIPDLKGKKVVQASAGDSHTVLVLDDGTAVAFGSNRDGQTTIPDLKGKKVVQASAGSIHTVLVLDDGTALAFGSHYDGRTTIPDLKGKKVVQASAGRLHTVLVLYDGTAVAFGNNGLGQTTTIPGLKGKKVVQASAGSDHTVLVLDDGTAVAFGSHYDGETTIPDLKGKKVVQASAGRCHTILVLDDWTAVAFGSNRDGQTTIPDLKGKKVVEASAGYEHTVLVLDDGTAVAFGSNWHGETTIPDLKGKIVAQGEGKKLLSELLGIQLSWFRKTFREDAQRSLVSLGNGDRRAEDMSFHELAPILAYGTMSYGQGKVYPRDGKVGCSIVDAVFDDGHSDRADYFLSWVWNYPLRVAVDALEESEETSTPSEFGVSSRSSLPRTGIDLEIILPSSSKVELDQIFKEFGMSGLGNAIEIDTEKATATSISDEQNIKTMISTTSSFAQVNATATKGLSKAILDEVKKALV